MNQVLEKFRTDLSTHSNCFIRSSEATNRNYVPKSGLRIEVAKRLTATTFRQLRCVNKNQVSRLACLDNRLSGFVQAKLPVKIHQMSSSVASWPTEGRSVVPVSRFETSNKLIPFWGANSNSIAPTAGFAFKCEAGRRRDRVNGQALLQVLLRKPRLCLAQSNCVDPITDAETGWNEVPVSRSATSIRLPPARARREARARYASSANRLATNGYSSGMNTLQWYVELPIEDQLVYLGLCSASLVAEQPKSRLEPTFGCLTARLAPGLIKLSTKQTAPLSNQRLVRAGSLTGSRAVRSHSSFKRLSERSSGNELCSARRGEPELRSGNKLRSARRGLRPSGHSKSFARPSGRAEPRQRPGHWACLSNRAGGRLNIETTVRFAEGRRGLSKNLSKRCAHTQNKRFFAGTNRVGGRFRLVAERLQHLGCYATKSRFGLQDKLNGRKPVRLTWNFALDTIYCGRNEVPISRVLSLAEQATLMSWADQGFLSSGGQSISSAQYFQKIVSKTKYKTIRPLLTLSRQNLTTLCKDLCLPVYPDKSNKAVQYSRNRLREQILPAVKLFFNPKIEDALFKLAELLTQDFTVVSDLINTGRRLKL